MKNEERTGFFILHSKFFILDPLDRCAAMPLRLRPMLPLLLAAAISAANVKAHIDFLASDVLEGRETGSRGYNVAAEYVASEFEALGLEHSFQPIRFRTAMVDGANCSMRLGDQTFAHKKD